MDFGASDIVERDTTDQIPAPPSAAPKKSFTKKWTTKRRPVVLDPTVATSSAPKSSDEPLSEPERIHLENIRRLQKMSPEEIEKERAEIFQSMDPNILESLLKRAEKKEAEVARQKTQTEMQTATQTETQTATQTETQTATAPPTTTSTKPSFKEPTVPITGYQAPAKGTMAEWDPSPSTAKTDSLSALPTPSDLSDSDSHVHFAAPGPDELRQYFPDLPVETEKLAWMQPIDDVEEVEYSTQLVSIAPSELRFDFHGDLVTPRRSREIPVSVGLHHHGDAPSAAGYTLPELAHLCRSTHPAQRALAIQTVGRVLHKLRLRKFARSSELQEGLEALVQQTRVLDSLTEAASDTTRSLTVRTRAIEALWLANTDNHQKNSEN